MMFAALDVVGAGGMVGSSTSGSGGIFISYRRQEADYVAGRLFDRLADRFGEQRVFMDVDSIEPGLDFGEAIDRAVSSCSVLLALIGQQWLTMTDEDGSRRLDHPDDIVRLEIQTALERDVRVVPVLVGGASMPQARDLPDSLAKLARRHAVAIHHESFRADAARLMESIERIFSAVAVEPPSVQVGTTLPPHAEPTIDGLDHLPTDAGEPGRGKDLAADPGSVQVPRYADRIDVPSSSSRRGESYKTAATAKAPALIIYLLDTGISMAVEIGGQRKIDLVSRTLVQVLRQVLMGSIKGTSISPRYRVAICAYNDVVRDIYSGPEPINKIVEIGIPVVRPSGRSNAAGAFERAEQLLRREWNNLLDCPAPLICHLTGGEFTGPDPLPIVQRIQELSLADGAVLIENVLFDANALWRPFADPYGWEGVHSADQLATDLAKRLFHMSSPVPSSYHQRFVDLGYGLRSDARLLFPGDTPGMIETAFTMSGMTPVLIPGVGP
jgi:TIR domain